MKRLTKNRRRNWRSVRTQITDDKDEREGRLYKSVIQKKVISTRLHKKERLNFIKKLHELLTGETTQRNYRY